jgi:hypothetical protein
VVARLRSKFRQCYNRQLAEDPSFNTGSVLTYKLTHDASRTITKVDFPCGALPPEFAACIRTIFVGHDDLFELTGKGETIVGPACAPPKTK